jgi:DNA-binding CsgD family transcriptional regulator
MEELLYVPQEHLAGILACPDNNTRRAYVLEHGIEADGLTYAANSGTMRSSLADVPPLWRDEVNGGVGRNKYDCYDPTSRNVPRMRTLHVDKDSNLPLDQLLTVQEFNVVVCLTLLAKNKDIAVRLSTSEGVIKNYLRDVFYKTALESRYELVVRYAEEWKAGLYPDMQCPIEHPEGTADLTEKEKLVLQYITKPDQDIADITSIQKRTVKSAVNRLKRKLSYETREQLSAYTVLHGNPHENISKRQA